ncbi:MAG: hypothetical protein L6Q71_05615 [Planctomycetes bacterium]|nr:hypothetical protein [Planctomycetota bacterium]
MTPPLGGVQTAAPSQIRFGGGGTVLGDVQQATYTPERFFQKVATYLKEGRTGSAARFVQRYPDVALEVLRAAGSYRASPETLIFIASSYDGLRSTREDTMHWTSLARERVAFPERFEAYDRERKRALSAMFEGYFDEASSVDLMGALPLERHSHLLDMDAWHLRGVVELLNNKPGKSATAFDNAITQSGNNHPHHVAYLMALSSDALRRDNKFNHAVDAWREGVVLAASLLEGNSPIADPALWEMLMYVKPVDSPWPDDVGIRFNALRTGPWDEHPEELYEAAPDRLILTWISRWRLQRGEGQAALLAARRAEAATLDDALRDSARLLEAKALLLIGQTAPATAILSTLTDKKDQDQLSRAAYAMLGVVNIHSGRSRTGLDLLLQALENSADYTWEGQAEAEADLGLAYLVVGDGEKGLMWLRRAQMFFEATGDFDSLVRSLKNERDYYDEIGENGLASQVQLRIDELRAY